jgi:vancomycin resistance protein YoaR
MAVAEEALPVGRTWSRSRRARRMLAFVVALGLGVGLVVGGMAAFHESLNGKILPGISVGGLQVGGMTREDARAALTAGFETLGTGSVTVRSSIALTTIPFVAVGRAADVDAMLSEAANRGRGGTWLDETVAAIRLAITPEALPVRVRFDPQLAASAVAGFASRTALGAVDASVVRTTSGFAMTHAVQGSRVDEAAALAAVEGVLDDPSRTGRTEVAAAVVPVAPALTNDRAANAILAARAMVADLAVSGSGSTWTLRASSVRGWITFGWLDGVYRPIVDRGVVAESLASIAKKVARPVRDAAFIRDRHGRIVGSMADRAGQVLDQPASADRIASAIEARITSPAPDAPPADDAVPLAVETVAPTLSTAQAAAKAPLMVKLGSWTTYYQVAAHNGFGANITVPTRTLNGTVVQPGQVFDFWSALGEVSFRTGYRLGGAIVGGHSVEGKALAGGICAASTTLFNAALRSGFEILTRQPHWYYITRYPLGLDATVSGSQTMRFRNDTPYPLVIRGFASPGITRFEIWSVPSGRTVSLSRPIVTNVVAGFDTTVKTATLKAGTSMRTEYPVDGKDVSVTRTVRDSSGRVIHRETYISHYHRMIGINLIGIG